MCDLDRIDVESAMPEALDHVAGPGFDRENQTAKLEVELVASALGARILWHLSS